MWTGSPTNKWQAVNSKQLNLQNVNGMTKQRYSYPCKINIIRSIAWLQC